MSEYELKLSKRGWLINIILLVVITVIGLILLASGLNEAFYSSSETVRSIFKIITNLGEPIVFILAVMVFYIAYDKKFAKNVAFSLLVTLYTNEILKNIFQDPRPATNIDLEEPEGMVETSYGFPSGHTQSAVGTWGYFAYNFKDKPKPLLVPIIMSVITFCFWLFAITNGTPLSVATSAAFSLVFMPPLPSLLLPSISHLSSGVICSTVWMSFAPCFLGFIV